MNPLHNADPEEIRRLLDQEKWLAPLPEIRHAGFRPWQKAVFWALRAYIVVLLLVVLWAFGHGIHG